MCRPSCRVCIMWSDLSQMRFEVSAQWHGCDLCCFFVVGLYALMSWHRRRTWELMKASQIYRNLFLEKVGCLPWKWHNVAIRYLPVLPLVSSVLVSAAVGVGSSTLQVNGSTAALEWKDSSEWSSFRSRLHYLLTGARGVTLSPHRLPIDPRHVSSQVIFWVILIHTWQFK